MNRPRESLNLVAFLLLSELLTTSMACSNISPGSDKGIREAVEQGLANQSGYLSVPEGEITIMSPLSSQVEREDAKRFKTGYVAVLKKFEAAGLVTLEEHLPNSNLEEIRRGGERYFLVTPTSAAVSNGEREGGVIKIQSDVVRIESIVRDSAYTSPQLPQSDQFRLVLGTVLSTPNSIMLRFDPSSKQQRARFKALLKYDPFEKRWRFVTSDYGEPDSGEWVTNNIP